MSSPLEAVTVGDPIPAWSVASVSAEKMKTVAALMRDPNPIHYDVAAVASLGLGDRVINQGPTNMAYIVNALLAWSGDVSALRRLTCRFHANVFAGDRLVASGVVTGVRHEDASVEVSCDVWLDRDGDRVVTGTARLEVPTPIDAHD